MSELNFKINKAKFLNALQISAKAVSPNSPVPSLCGIRINADDSGLTLTSSDADISIEMTLSNTDDEKLGLSVITPGTVVIDARYLLEIVKKIDTDEINVEIIDGTLTRFSGGKAEFKINGYRSADYPTMDFSKPAVSFTLKYRELAALISETVFAASAKETRPVLTGVNFANKGTELVCTSTDSYRLARKVIHVEAEPFTITVPAKSLSEARSIFANEDDVEIAVSTKKIQFISKNIVMQSRLLDGTYPETDRLIPKEFTRTLVISRNALISAIDRTSFIKTDNMTIIRLQMNSSDDISVSNKSQEIGEFHEDLVAESYEGAPIDISFAGNYVLDAARALSSDRIRIQFTGEMKPFILTNVDGEDNILQLVLPVRTYN